MFRCHESHTPAFITNTVSNLFQKLFLRFGWRHPLCKGNQDLKGQEPH
jgi:hypothetical protein